MADIGDKIDPRVCQICFEIYLSERAGRQTRNLPCGHTFCLGCLQSLLSTSPRNALTCPNCRAIVALNSTALAALPRVYSLEGASQPMPALSPSRSSGKDPAMDGSAGQVCENEGCALEAALLCKNCNSALCKECDEEIHFNAILKRHMRVNLAQGPPMLCPDDDEALSLSQDTGNVLCNGIEPGDNHHSHPTKHANEVAVNECEQLMRHVESLEGEKQCIATDSPQQSDCPSPAAVPAPPPPPAAPSPAAGAQRYCTAAPALPAPRLAPSPAASNRAVAPARRPFWGRAGLWLAGSLATCMPGRVRAAKSVTSGAPPFPLPAVLTPLPAVLTPEPPGTLGSKWATYKNAVQSVLELVVQRKYSETKSIIKGLDNLVSEISELLLQQCVPASTTVFYGLPLSVTATRTGAEASVKWSKVYRWGDHWVIENEMNMWVAWRQETLYFFYVMDHEVGHDLFSDTLKRGDALLSTEMFESFI